MHRAGAFIAAFATCLLLAACSHAPAGFAIDDSPPMAPDTLPVDSSRAPDLADTIHAITPEREDCDGNGIPDVVDLREGNEDDVNGNRVPDPCDRDTSLLAHPQNTRWKLYALRPDTSFFWTGYQRRARAEGGEVVAVRYTVPLGGAEVRLDVFDARGAVVVTLVNKRQDSGAYETAWHRDRPDGKEAAPGAYRLRLDVNGRGVVRRVRWAR